MQSLSHSVMSAFVFFLKKFRRFSLFLLLLLLLLLILLVLVVVLLLDVFAYFVKLIYLLHQGGCIHRYLGSDLRYLQTRIKNAHFFFSSMIISHASYTRSTRRTNCRSKIPPHVIDILQPVDVTCFGLLKRTWEKLLHIRVNTFGAKH